MPKEGKHKKYVIVCNRCNNKRRVYSSLEKLCDRCKAHNRRETVLKSEMKRKERHMEEKKNIIAKSAEIVQEFSPLPSMEKWLDTAIELATDSPTHISKESGLSKTNWYEWLKRPGFEDWYYEQYAKKRRRWLPTLDKIGMTQSKKGEYNFWRDMNKKAGESLEDKGTAIRAQGKEMTVEFIRRGE